jgi:hypothetical protein
MNTDKLMSLRVLRPGAQNFCLASEHVADRSLTDVVHLMNGYKTQFLNTQPINGDGVDNKMIVVVFTDLSWIAPKACLATS